MTAIDLTAGYLPIHGEPSDAISIPLTVPAGFETGTWTAKVYGDTRKTAVLATCTVVVAAPVVTISLTTAQVGALVTAGMSRFAGHWELDRTVAGEARTWLKGPFVLDANRQTVPSGTDAVALSIVDNAVTVTSTAAAALPHASRHLSDGADPIAAATSTVGGLMAAADRVKLDGVEAGATGDQTATEILTAVKTVDGAGSGLDADLLDGADSTAYATSVGLSTEISDRASADAAHTADTTAVHGIPDTAVLATATTVATAVSDHAAAVDPHADRAFATTAVANAIAALIDSAPGTLDTLNEIAAALGDDPNFAATLVSSLAGKQPIDADLTALAALAPTNDDVVQRKAGVWTNRTAAQYLVDLLAAGLQTSLDGKVNDTGDTITGDLTISDGSSKAYRLRRGGSALDFEGTGADIYFSVWSGSVFDGTQRVYMRLESASPVMHIVGVVYFGATPTDLAQFINPTTGIASLGAKNSLANIRLCGYRSSAGAPTTGTWTTDDQVIDVNGIWWRCTATGTPGTWTSLTASAIPTTPAGGLAASTVAAALNELDTEKARLDGAAHTGTDTWTLAATTTDAVTTKVTGDAVERLVVNADGKHEWSDGTAAADTTLYRSGADLLRTDDDLRLRRVGTANIDSRYLCYIAGTHPSTATLVVGFGCEYTAPATCTATAHGAAFQVRTAAAAFTLTTMNCVICQAPTVGSGSTITNLYGVKVDPMIGATNNYGVAVGAASTQTLWVCSDVNGTTPAQGIAFGSSRDTTLYRSAAGTLATDGTFKTGVGATGARPNAVTVGAGAQWWDSTLKKPIWSDGAIWVDATGTAV